MREGDVWAVPVPRLGFCPLLIADVDFAYAYLQPKLFDRPPVPEWIAPLAEWTSAWLGLVSTAPFVKKRWTRCGALAQFERAAWPVAPSRNSAVDETEPVEQWGQHPWGEMWSIETTADEPSMTVSPTWLQRATRLFAFRGRG